MAAIALVTPVALHAQPCEWEAIDGATFSSRIRAIAKFNEGSGPRLFVGGVFSQALGSPASNIARWDFERWSQVGAGIGGSIYALQVHDDGRGVAFFATGAFTRAGDVKEANAVARWDGSVWSALGSGLHNDEPPHYRGGSALAVFDDGAGPALYVAGRFTHAGGVPALNIARWDGSEWSAMGEGLPGIVRALAVYDDGSGPALYAGGTGLWRWEGTSWSAVPVPPGLFDALAVFDDGAGPALFAGGQIAGHIVRWDGASWTTPGGGMNAAVRSFHVFDDGRGEALYAGGAFLRAGPLSTYGIARWDGREWSEVGGGMYKYPIGPSVDAMATFDDGSGPALYVGGTFTHAGGGGGIAVDNIARWRCDLCYADCDGDGSLEFFDFLCFQNLFAAGDAAADCDGSGELDFFDFLCFQNAFAAGCE